jgi:hypothetical protein
MRITDAGVRRRVIAASVLAELEAELAEHLGERTTAALRAAASRPWPDLAT